ncbi:KAT8 regulatory NSL complex subunit 1-like isoform X2 [Branchiostoma floridae x Branchiostoma belcheri]
MAAMAPALTEAPAATQPGPRGLKPGADPDTSAELTRLDTKHGPVDELASLDSSPRVNGEPDGDRASLPARTTLPTFVSKELIHRGLSDGTAPSLPVGLKLNSTNSMILKSKPLNNPPISDQKSTICSGPTMSVANSNTSPTQSPLTQTTCNNESGSPTNVSNSQKTENSTSTNQESSSRNAENSRSDHTEDPGKEDPACSSSSNSKCECSCEDVANCNSTSSSNSSQNDTTSKCTCGKQQQPPPPSQGLNLELREAIFTGRLSDVEERQFALQRRSERLERRLRKLQCRQAASHSRVQLGAFLDQALPPQLDSSSSKVEVKSELDQTVVSSGSSQVGAGDSTPPQPAHRSASLLAQRLLATRTPPFEGQSPGSEGSWRRKLSGEVADVTGRLQTNLKHLERCIDSDATESSSGGESEDEDAVADSNAVLHDFPLHKCATWKWAMDRAAIASRWTWLQAQVSDLEYRIRQQSDIFRQIRAAKGQVVLGDPESPKEFFTTSRTKPNRKLSPIEAKIANLERSSQLSPCNISQLLSNVDKQASKLTQSLGNCYSPRTASPVASTASTTAGGDSSNGNGSSKSKVPAPKPMNGLVDGAAKFPAESELSDLDDPAHKKLRLDAVATPPPTVGNDLTCQCARTRPVRSYRKRKLLRTFGMWQVCRKASKLSTVRCGCAPPNTPCVMCGGRLNNAQKVEPNLSSQVERVAIMDPSFHPVLSFPQDIPLSVHFQSLLKTGDWQNRPTPKPSQSNKRLKGSPVTPSPSQYQRAADNRARRVSKKLAQSAAAALLTTAKLRGNKVDGKQLSRSLSGSLPCTPKPNTADGTRLCRTDARKKRAAAQLAIAAFSKKNRLRNRSLSLTHVSGRDRGYHATPSPTSSDSPNTPLSISCPANSLQAVLNKKRQGHSAFDINNIVIPYSMASTTRVERLKYKEILTPKWRKVSKAGKEEPETPEKETPVVPNGTAETEEPEREEEEEEEEIEDLSDDLISVRHNKCEHAEKQRFLAFVTHKSRSRSNRTNSGTPEPASPDVNLDSSMGTPLSLNIPSPLTPVSKDSPISPANVTRQNSKGRRSSTEEGPRSATPSIEDFGGWLDPWPRRKFPLNEEEYNFLISPMAPHPPPPPAALRPTTTTPLTTRSVDGEVNALTLPAMTPAPPNVDTPPAEVMMETDDSEDDPEDPNDPEWTIVSPARARVNTTRPSIVLRLAKR